ncbi:uncharacterized protein LOC130993850 [Salvia miltiorrhiza]|uniref:uncharacterized protein LOC130993850 n=1 Tax=Salvia miltiorrhiza TaxID=226208 RepID=UPI0025AD413B|nr:uncharacterized protein LOC130993850 [Salvia miltiorrhiza]
MSSWICVSEDKQKGKNQRGATMWERVQNMYHEAQKENPDEISPRNIESMKGHFKRLNENANKWIAACKEANARKRSGMSQKDIEMEAHSIYEAGGSKFQDLVVFNDVMSKHPKWNLAINEVGDDQESGGSTKRSKTSEDGDYFIPSNPETPTTGGSTMSRPTGRDKAKRKGKGKAMASESNEMYEEIRALRLSRDHENELMTAKIELEREKLKMNSLKMEKKMLVALLAKDHLSAEEEEMKSHLIAILFPK